MVPAGRMHCKILLIAKMARAICPCAGFGWFFRYLTFYTYTLQLAQLILCCLPPLAKARLSNRVHS